jgi:hypothetical protein
VLLTGCTTIRYTDPTTGSPIFVYQSTKDIAAEGLLVEVEYYEGGSVKLIHVELGTATGNASKVVEQYAKIAESVAEGVVKGIASSVSPAGPAMRYIPRFR